MAKRYISNDGDQTIFVGGVMILPGTGREVDEAYLPPEHQQPLPEAAPGNPAGDLADAGARAAANLAELVAQPLRQLVPALTDCSDETLAQLATLESEREAPRAGLLSAIAELQLKRAQAKTGGDPA